mmetsp:Transcript_71600/g.207318  ORF Transcript_71600/g.207318 Transcript_71600/m.207318 type:complete len:207 (-) Transcript_71600:209-829(-)
MFAVRGLRATGYKSKSISETFKRAVMFAESRSIENSTAPQFSEFMQRQRYCQTTLFNLNWSSGWREHVRCSVKWCSKSSALVHAKRCRAVASWLWISATFSETNSTMTCADIMRTESPATHQKLHTGCSANVGPVRLLSRRAENACTCAVSTIDGSKGSARRPVCVPTWSAARGSTTWCLGFRWAFVRFTCKMLLGETSTSTKPST